MLKRIILMGFMLIAVPALAQEVFWGYDDEDREMIVPPECDATFDPQELYDIGMHLMEETGSARMGSGYCLLSSAMAGNADAQFQVAKMYHKGALLPQSELAAYKWATAAALSGHEEADQLGAAIEQYLSIQDIELSTKSLQDVISLLKKNKKEELTELQAQYEETKSKLADVRRDLQDLEVYGEIQPRAASKPVQANPGTLKTPGPKQLSKPKAGGKQAAGSIFSQADLDAAPMPTR